MLQNTVVIEGEVELRNVIDGDPNVVIIVDGRTHYDVTYSLATNIVSSNTSAKVTESSAYITTISSNNADYFVGTITVLMGGVNITSQVVSDNTITIPSVTGDISITVTAVYYPGVVLESSALEITSGGTGKVKVKLNGEPTQNQIVSLFTNGNVTLSISTLLFTSSNWNTYQEVTVTGASVEYTEYAYVEVVNSDPLMTEYTVMVTVKALGYGDLVDTTIPTTGQHVLTLSDFTSTQDTTIDGVTYVRLYTYNGSYTNVVMPAVMENKRTLTVATTFKQNTTVEYVTFEDGCRVGEAGAPSNNKLPNGFNGCTNLVGVSNFPTSAVDIGGLFSGCTSFKFVDNLDELTNLTSLGSTFKDCTSLEYIQDLSSITGCGLNTTFRGCTNLKKIFGIPQPTTAQSFEYAFMGTQVERVTIPENANKLIYLFYNNSHVNHVTILADGLESSALTQIVGSPSQQIDIYANPNSTTLASLQSMFASSTKVSVHEIGGGSDLPKIVVWGDSTSSPAKPWGEWPARLQVKLGTTNFAVKNEAVSGEFTTSTSARQGGNAIHTNAFAIPADTTATLVTLTTTDGQTFSNSPVFSGGGSWNPCVIEGIEGLISKSGTNYYFTRTTEGSAVSVPSETVVESKNDSYYNNSESIMLIQMGHNAGWDGVPAKLLNQMQLMVDHFEDLGGTDYIVTGPWSGGWMGGGWETTQQFNALAAEAFGSHWLNLPQDIADHCQTDNPEWVPTADDLEYISEGKTPMGLTSDGSHPTEYGANSQMMAFYRKGVALGYWQ